MIRLHRSGFLRWLLVGFLSLTSALTFAACTSTPPNSNLASPSAVLKIATSPSFAPFESLSPGGTPVGFDIDLIQAIGEVSGFSVDLQSVEFFDDIIRNLYAGSVDAAISAITITPERAEVVSFSRPYFKSGLAIAVPTSNTDITSAENLQGKRIGAQVGTTGAREARSIANATVITYDTALAALQDLADGKIDAVINDFPATAYVLKSGVLDLKMLDIRITEELYGIAVPKNSINLERIDLGLSAVIENGKYAEIYRKWFNADPSPLPQHKTVVGGLPAKRS